MKKGTITKEIASNMRQFSEKFEEILNLVLDEEIKVVSFDLFDTLVVRPCIAPVDMFRIVKKRAGLGYDFCGVRKAAEARARMNRPLGNDDITISDIYDEFRNIMLISKEEGERIKKIELDTELDLIRPRKTVCEAFRILHEAGKRIYIITDIYLDRAFIEELLSKNGIDTYDGLYVSSEMKVAKGTGRLFERVIDDLKLLGIEPKQMYHMGDNKRADVDIPQELGINTVHLPKTSDIFMEKCRLKVLANYAKLNDNTFLIGCLANFLFDDPYRIWEKDSFFDGDAYNMGVVLFGPFLMSFVCWMIKECYEKKIDTLLLAYRDGFMIEKIMEIIEQYCQINLIKEKVYLSRAIRLYFSLKSYEDFLNALEYFPVEETMTVNRFIKRRLLVGQVENFNKVWEIFREAGYVDPESPIGRPEKYLCVLAQLWPLVREISESERMTITEYCLEKKGDGKEIAVFDVGYRGSVSRFLLDEIGIKNTFFQIKSNPKLYEGLKEDYDLNTYIDAGYAKTNDMFVSHQLMEDVISVQEGSALRIEKHGANFEIVRDQFAGENETISAIQKGIIDYCDYVMNTLADEILDFEFNRYDLWRVMEDFLIRPSLKDAKIITSLRFEDSKFISHSTSKNAYVQWGEIKGVIDCENKYKVQLSKLRIFTNLALKKANIYDPAVRIKRVFDIKKREEILDKYFCDENKRCIVDCSEIEKDKPIFLFFGHMIEFDKGTLDYMRAIQRQNNNERVLLFSESRQFDKAATHNRYNLPFVLAPSYMGKGGYEIKSNVVCSAEMHRFVKKDEILSMALDNIKASYPDMEKEYACAIVYYSYQLLDEVFDILTPIRVMLWNEFSGMHMILRKICKDKNINVMFMEFGAIPGTFSIEKLGQMGESYPARYVSDFLSMHVSEDQRAFASTLIEDQRISGANRNVQPINSNIKAIIKKIKKTRPVILYAGVDDYEAGLFPYTIETAKYHSPVCRSSEDGLFKIAKIAKKHDWNIIYKPHPILERWVDDSDPKYSGIIIAKRVDINGIIDVADVVVTIMSQVSYIALTREKPVIMLGYNQLKGKGCTYEAFEKGAIENALNDAIAYGYTNEMKECFITHVAQMLKYNLFDDLQPREKRYGRSIDAAVDYIWNQDNDEIYKQQYDYQKSN